jgi:hypothetical protein
MKVDPALSIWKRAVLRAYRVRMGALVLLSLPFFAFRDDFQAAARFSRVMLVSFMLRIALIARRPVGVT